MSSSDLSDPDLAYESQLNPELDPQKNVLADSKAVGTEGYDV
jgi:hypothetical protein